MGRPGVPSQTLNSLQAARGLAALAVAAFHLSISMGVARYGGHTVFQEYTRFGNRGVDFFFVLSGFIILLAHRGDIGRPQAAGAYLHKRFTRVFPVYWLYTLAFALAYLIFGATDAALPASSVGWLTSLSLVRFDAAVPPLPVAWTLFHEVAFYAVFAALLLHRTLGLLALAAFALIAILNYGYPHEGARNAYAVYTSGYNLFFLLGMGACLLHLRGVGGLGMLLAGAAVVVGGISLAPRLGTASPLVVATGFALLLAGVTGLERRGGLRVPRWLQLLGNASFTIYLTHLALEGLLLKIAMRLGLYAAAGPATTYLAVLAGTTALGCVAYWIVERPLLEALRRPASRVDLPQPMPPPVPDRARVEAAPALPPGSDALPPVEADDRYVRPTYAARPSAAATPVAKQAVSR